MKNQDESMTFIDPNDEYDYSCLKSSKILKKYLDARISVAILNCADRLNFLYHLEKRIEFLDKQYGRYLDEHMLRNKFDKILQNEEDRRNNRYCFFPFFENYEFISFLVHAEAFLDSFSDVLAMLYFNQTVRDFSRFVSLLRNMRDEKSKLILNQIENSLRDLKGVLIDFDDYEMPKNIRDIGVHRNGKIAYFFVYEDRTRTQNAFLHQQNNLLLVNQNNFFVPNICSRTWLALRSFSNEVLDF